MKKMKTLAILIIIGLITFKPNGNTQVISPAVVIKMEENKKLKADIQTSIDSSLNNLKTAAKEIKEVKRQPRTVYITRWRTKRTDTVYVVTPPHECDTIYYLIKKNNWMQRMSGSKKMDTTKSN